MMQAVEYHDVKGTGRLNLPPLDEMTGQDAEAVVTAGEVNADFGTEVWADDPRIRRLRALDGYVEQLRFDVPPAQPPTEFWKKFGAKTTKRAEEKHMRVMLNNRDMSRKEGKRAQLDESEAKVAGKILWLVIENLDDNRRPSSSHSSFSSEPPSSITDPVPAGLSAASSEPSQRSHTKS
ncbi:MAG: hypothetical protein M1820_010636 [Bogoriella megaspora]|nr:MAG: hypothetical protein M1820_010636 [Bogoriella megaspora]